MKLRAVLHSLLSSSLVGSSAEQPARVAAQPVKALRSITDVQRWLKNNEVVLSSSAEVMRIREVVDELSRKPKPRQEAIQRFFKPWGVQQCIKKDRRPLRELIEELNLKVVDASKMLQQQLSDSAERPGSSMVSSAAQQLQVELSGSVEQSSRKRDQERWTPEESPAKTSKCRTLSRSPTGPELPDYDLFL